MPPRIVGGGRAPSHRRSGLAKVGGPEAPLGWPTWASSGRYCVRPKSSSSHVSHIEGRTRAISGGETMTFASVVDRLSGRALGSKLSSFLAVLILCAAVSAAVVGSAPAGAIFNAPRSFD